MIIRQRGLSSLWLLLLLISAARSQLNEDCHLTIGTTSDHTISRSRPLPPTNMTDTLRFNICNELSLLEGVSSGDQCSSGTWACLSKTNIKQGESDRIVAVIPLAQGPELRAEYTRLSSPRGVQMRLHGPVYPSSTTLEPTPQEFVVDLLCATEESQAVFKSYDGTRALVEWSAPSGCNFRSDPSSGGDSKTPDKEAEAVGSGIGWFFLLLFVGFAGYFALGAYYNYTTYGATGMDLIPHRDFWREVPYMLRDVVSHLCSSFQSRHSTSRGGYMAV
ncbi:autophagy-related protein 27 [Russula aff. rugulosa BPL654]|nr:autophagy-related protein 27 [Russula aff. rugulosa BPL654]